MRGLRRTVPRFVAATILGALVGCGDPNSVVEPPRAADTTSPGDQSGSFATSFDLPFGLVQLEGTEPIGRPIAHEDVDVVHDGVPIRARGLSAAYRVTDDDPVEVFRRWVDQIAAAQLALDRIDLHPGMDPGQPWLTAYGSADFVPFEPPGDYASVQLWATASEPILLVGVSRRVGGDPPRAPEVVEHPPYSDEPERAPGVTGGPSYRGVVVEETERIPGDELFTEQGDTVHLPTGTRPLMPTIPIQAGTGGSFSLLAADDGDAAISELLAEAEAFDESGSASEPVVTVEDGTRIVTANFGIPAGGWSFTVTAVRSEGDPYATVMVSSAAD